jgi:hypothetical protein
MQKRMAKLADATSRKGGNLQSPNLGRNWSIFNELNPRQVEV